MKFSLGELLLELLDLPLHTPGLQHDVAMTSWLLRHLQISSFCLGVLFFKRGDDHSLNPRSLKAAKRCLDTGMISSGHLLLLTLRFISSLTPLEEANTCWALLPSREHPKLYFKIWPRQICPH